jgi:NAD(P)-dependent dehydrogenase (short-subunit alcohol dehydrogenase family)
MASFVTNHPTPYEALTKRIVAKPLVGKKVLITGASRGVGLHIAHGIATAGATTIGLVGRDPARLDATKAKLTTTYPNTTFHSFALDIMDATAVSAVFTAFGVPDILVNNAGVFADSGDFINQDLKEWWKGYETNVLGTAIVTQAYLVAKGGPSVPGIVLNCSSMAAHMRLPFRGWSGYNSSKLAQARVFEMLRFEHPEVRWVSIHPGQIETDGYERTGATRPPVMTEGEVAGLFFAWAGTKEAEFLSGRFVWAEWDVDELVAKKEEILERDLLLVTIDGFEKGM